jgi:hypothetical protein
LAIQIKVVSFPLEAEACFLKIFDSTANVHIIQ